MLLIGDQIRRNGMLVLSRKTNQRIVIADNVELVVVAISGRRVKLGFNAPADVPIHREEVRHRIESERSVKWNNDLLSTCVTPEVGQAEPDNPLKSNKDLLSRCVT